MESAPARISSFRAWWAVFVLFLAYIFSYIDRYILGLLVDPLKADLQLTDTQVGLLGGAAFAIFYSTVGLVMARYSDRGSRRVIIAAGVALWSAATMVCGMAQSYVQLFLGRMGVGAGEAVLGPASISLVADLFPKEQRGFALGAFMTANHIGGALALMIGGAVVHFLQHAPAIGTWFGDLKSWQVVFLAVGAPGLLVALLAFTIPEPRRDLSEKIPDAPMSEFFRFTRGNGWLLGGLFVIFALAGALNFAFNVWSPAFLMRHYDFNAREVGFFLGLPALILAPTGGLIAGWLLHRWTKKGRDDAPLIVAQIAMITSWPFFALIPLMPTVDATRIVYIVSCIFDGMAWVAVNAAMQLMTPPNMRARVGALYAFCVTILALLIGPTAVALLSDHLYSPAEVGKSIATIALILGPIASLALPFTLAPYRRAVRHTLAMEKAG